MRIRTRLPALVTALLGLVAAPRTARADTIINGGTLASPVHWHAASGPYVVLGDLTITGNGGFIIDPGTTIVFPGGDSQASGLDPTLTEITAPAITINGTTMSPVVFEAQNGTTPG